MAVRYASDLRTVFGRNPVVKKRVRKKPSKILRVPSRNRQISNVLIISWNGKIDFLNICLGRTNGPANTSVSYSKDKKQCTCILNTKYRGQMRQLGTVKWILPCLRRTRENQLYFYILLISPPPL